MVSVQSVLDQLMEPVDRIEDTVDTLKFGDPNIEVKGIATTFTATYRVLKETIDLGANLLITHEGLFYHHRDKVNYLADDPVYLEKRKFIEESGLAIYRFHDYWHRYKPDGVMKGLIQTLEWQSYVEKYSSASVILTIPSMTIERVAEHMKKKLDIGFLRCLGDLSMTSKRVGMLVGYRGGGEMAIPLFEEENLDLIIVGEGPEWETPEYVKDGISQGRQKALMILGHAESEEPGMKYLAQLLNDKFPDIPTHFIPGEQPFQVI